MFPLPGTTTPGSVGFNNSWIVGGEWALAVINGSATGAAHDFVMVQPDGDGRHYMNNIFVPDNKTVELNLNGNTTITGTSTVREGLDRIWSNVDTNITLIEGNAFNLDLESEDIEHHFGGQSVYGTVNSLTDAEGNQLIAGFR